jgi:hypothetical protein
MAAEWGVCPLLQGPAAVAVHRLTVVTEDEAGSRRGTSLSAAAACCTVHTDA